MRKVLLLATLLSTLAPALADRPVIVAFGDSITFGPGMKPGETYPEQLQTLLTEQLGEGAPQVINAGVGGNTVLAGLARLDNDVLAHQPRVVLIGFGMNDSVMVAAGQPRVSLEQFGEKLTELVTRVRAAGAQTILATLTPVVEEYYFERHPRDWYPEGLKADLAQYDAAIAAEATQSPLVDLHGLDPAQHLRLPENAGLRDGVHPTAAGYGVMAAAYARALAPLLQ
jgi:acyl-CoA thioesterase-1